MVDEKIAALAAEYEKARKQNIQLREALKAKDRRIQELESKSAGGDASGLRKEILSLRSELDSHLFEHNKQISDLNGQIDRLKHENAELLEKQKEPPETFELAIQTENLFEEDDQAEIKRLQGVNVELSAEIAELRKKHEAEISAIMLSKTLSNKNPVSLPQELKIIDESDLGTVKNWSENNVYGVETFYQIRINNLIETIQHMLASTSLSRAEMNASCNRLQHTEQQRLSGINQLREEQETRRKLEQELDTTRKGYEAQLNTMTEELAQYLNKADGLNGTSEVATNEKKKRGFGAFFSKSST
ncbi:Oidioi.mRNA.OKI2018_I69.chr2.g6563.t1.cds [Oikopleura dioica]|uniref:Oidioi.mRNA.OKI2018_I69.chr2.g6563.t1.cds n=1 Tax=Oikopleura dioica TaxID=34765 RepID=A0ABN7TAC1_OIKDI|nr:Oidioi.mRNA.OKI2018_I69.chr2.g6563.t1.cds [Oikopleura dioica]